MQKLDSYSREQEAGLANRLARGESLRCPTCGGAFDERSVEPRADVSYVRSRLWVVCPRCRREAVLERR